MQLSNPAIPHWLTKELQIYKRSDCAERSAGGDRLGKIHNQPSWEASACSLATASAITRRNHSERLDLLRT